MLGERCMLVSGWRGPMLCTLCASGPSTPRMFTERSVQSSAMPGCGTTKEAKLDQLLLL